MEKALRNLQAARIILYLVVTDGKVVASSLFLHIFVASFIFDLCPPLDQACA